MATTLTNVSHDGSPVQFRMDSPLLACFDPLALDMLRDLLPAGARVDVATLLERANANHTALACFTIPEFRPGLFTLDPHDIKRFGDEDEDLDYSEDEQVEGETSERLSFPFVAVDSAALIVADVGHLPGLVNLLTWEQYDLALQDETVFETSR